MIQEYQRAFLSDPVGSSALVYAARWVEGTLLGTVASVIAVLCVAAVGFLMLRGRLEVRRGLIVVLGCFVLFGARTIVEGVRNVDRAESEVAIVPIEPPPVVEVPPANSAAPYDPYAGASLRR